MKAAIILFGAFVLIAGNKVNSPPTPEECWAEMRKHAPKEKPRAQLWPRNRPVAAKRNWA